METYTITLKCDEYTAKRILEMDGKTLRDQFLNIITTEKETTK